MDISSVTLCSLLKNEAFAKFVFSLIPIAISFTSDKACQRILHNSEAAKIYRLHEWEGYGLESGFNVYHKNKLLPPEGMPIGISMWENKLVREMELDLVWPDGVKRKQKVCCCYAGYTIERLGFARSPLKMKYPWDRRKIKLGRLITKDLI